MKNKKIVIISIVAFIIFIFSAGFIYSKLSAKMGGQDNLFQSNQSTEEGEPTKIEAADFTVTDKDGVSVNLSDFEGKPTVVNFWASWCGPCQMEMPDFNEKYKEYGDEINFLMVNITDGNRETIDSAKKFLEGTDYTFPVYFDTELDASNTYRVVSLPTTLFIDSEGYGIAQATGMINSELLQKGIDMIYVSSEEDIQ